MARLPHIASFLRAEGLEKWIAIQHYFDRAFVQRDEHFNDFLLRIGGLYSVKGRVFETPSRDTYAIIGVLRSPKVGPLDGDEIGCLTASLNGHFRCAAALHHKLSAARPNGRLLEAAMDKLSLGILIVDWRGKVLAANRTAQNMLQTGDALIERSGVLRARHQDDQRLHPFSCWCRWVQAARGQRLHSPVTSVRKAGLHRDGGPAN